MMRTCVRWVTGMLGFLKGIHWSWAKVPRRESWTLDRKWHRAEAERHLKSRNYAEAEQHFTFAVEEADERKAPAAQRIRLRLELAEAQRRRAIPAAGAGEPDRNRLQAAEGNVRAAIDIAAATNNAEEYVNCLDALADVYYDMGHWAALEKAEQEAIRLGAALSHPDPLRMARRVHRLGVARHKNGHLEEAIPALEKAVKLHEDAYGENHVVTGDLLSEVGRIYRAQGNHDKSQAYLRRALRIHEAEYGPDSPQALADLQQLAGSLEESGDLDAAAAQYERALLMKLRKLGVGNLEEVAEMQYSLATLHVGWGNLSRARELLSECIGAFRNRGGARLAVAHEMLAQVEERSGRFHMTVRELEEAAKVWEKCGKSRMPELIRNLEYRADLLDQLRKAREANWLRERIEELRSEKAQTA